MKHAAAAQPSWARRRRRPWRATNLSHSSSRLQQRMRTQHSSLLLLILPLLQVLQERQSKRKVRAVMVFVVVTAAVVALTSLSLSLSSISSAPSIDSTNDTLGTATVPAAGSIDAQEEKGKQFFGIAVVDLVAVVALTSLSLYRQFPPLLLLILLMILSQMLL